MNVVDDPAAVSHGASHASAACSTGVPAAVGTTVGAGEIELVWPRRFDLSVVRDLLGEEADQICCDVLAAGVSTPVWTLLDRRGGRWRPAICRLAYLASGGTPPAPAPICQIAELLHTGSLIIDDIQDEANERRGGPAVHVVHGTPTALNAADAAYFRALNALRPMLPDGLRLRALDMLSEELFAAHLGQALDLALGPRMRAGTIGLAHYAVLARAKTGALVRIAARLGAIAAAAPTEVEAALAVWAGELGVAYQIRNDCDDLASGRRDIATCRPTYPLLLVLEDGGAAASLLRARLGIPTTGLDDALRAVLENHRIMARALEAAERAAQRALEALRALSAAEGRRGLEELTVELVAPAGQPAP
jgi:geranylgeranyl diphosphate synthase type I